jgi:hypothetical protein
VAGFKLNQPFLTIACRWRSRWSASRDGHRGCSAPADAFEKSTSFRDRRSALVAA